MPRLTTPQELDQLVALIAVTPDGIGIEGLLQGQGNILQRRALQRRLAKLVEQGRIQTLGAARSVRYRIAPQATVVKDLALSAAPGQITLTGHQATLEIYVPTSPEGEAIKACLLYTSPSPRD